MAGLMTVCKMLRSGHFAGRTFLLIDPDDKTANDRTWCFWEKGSGHWDGILAHRWEQARFADDTGERDFLLRPYWYKMIRSSDFYRVMQQEIERYPNVSWEKAAVLSFSDTGNGITVKTGQGDISGRKLFNSLYAPPDDPKIPVLQQHFIGWSIRTEKDAFDAARATFMDFSVPQNGNTRFMYVLPTSSNEALIEYTLFSKDLLPQTEYEDAIREYISRNGITEYAIVEKERGSIPMTAFPFWKRNTQNILHIGTAGGWTKASTGYTFRNADKKSDELAIFLKAETDLRKFHRANRFLFYDSLLLDILDRSNEKGRAIFSSLFRKGDPATVFRFLDEETTLAEDLAVIARCPKMPFLKALFRNMTG